MRNYLYNMFFFQIIWIQSYLTSFCLWVIQKLNRSKNRCLASDFYNLACEYEPSYNGYDGEQMQKRNLAHDLYELDHIDG